LIRPADNAATRECRIPPLERIPQIGECSTPEELREYLKRAGFQSAQSKLGDELIAVWGRKP
jgi:hypothetical protein